MLAAVTIRPATVADAPALATLRYRFRTEHAAPVEDEAAFVARAGAWMRDHLARADWRAWVACDTGGVIVGHLWAHLIEKIPNPVPESEAIAYLTNVYVAPSHRNAGVGSRLVQAALDMLDTLDVETTVLWASARSGPLYARHGFGPPQTILERPSSS